MLSIFLDPTVFAEIADFQREVSRFIEFVKSARTVSPDGRILMPGEIEVQNRTQRLEHGIELDAQTWSQICATSAVDQSLLGELPVGASQHRQPFFGPP